MWRRSTPTVDSVREPDCEVTVRVALTADGILAHIVDVETAPTSGCRREPEFRDFLREVEEEAQREGPKAVAELRAFDAHFKLAAELILLRKQRGLTQRQLSTRSGVQQAEISRIEGGRANPTVTTLSALASALGAELGIRILATSNGQRKGRLRRGGRIARGRGAAGDAGRGALIGPPTAASSRREGWLAPESGPVPRPRRLGSRGLLVGRRIAGRLGVTKPTAPPCRGDRPGGRHPGVQARHLRRGAGVCDIARDDHLIVLAKRNARRPGAAPDRPQCATWAAAIPTSARCWTRVGERFSSTRSFTLHHERLGAALGRPRGRPSATNILANSTSAASSAG